MNDKRFGLDGHALERVRRIIGYRARQASEQIERQAVHNRRGSGYRFEQPT